MDHFKFPLQHSKNSFVLAWNAELEPTFSFAIQFSDRKMFKGIKFTKHSNFSISNDFLFSIEQFFHNLGKRNIFLET